MTFLELQNAVMNRLNLTSTDARTRIKAELNLRYREVQSSVSLAKTRYGTITFTTTSGVSNVTQSGVAKLLTVFDPITLDQPLNEVSLDQLRWLDPSESVQGIPTDYAIVKHINDSLTLKLYPQPVATATLTADALLAGTDMTADGDVPTIPTDYHDILVHGALYDELMKMEKMRPLAEQEEAKFQRRLSDLRYFIAKSAYLSRRPVDRVGEVVGFGRQVWPYANLA